VRLFNEALTPEEVFTVSTQKGEFILPQSDAPTLAVKAMGDDLVFTFDSKGGKLYTLRSNANFDIPTSSWPVLGGNMDIAATPPENTLTIARPADPKTFFVIEEFDAPPVAILSDDFESGQGAWTTGSDGASGTAWELGSPSVVGPPVANSGANCFGTNIAANYEFSANVWLRSPVIDLRLAGGATLNFAYFLSAEPGDAPLDPPYDSATVNVVDMGNNILATLEVLGNEITTDWTAFSMALPEAALGKEIKLEFRLVSDDINNGPGWYIDDVVVTVP
jgi:hypothetical protein